MNKENKIDSLLLTDREILEQYNRDSVYVGNPQYVCTPSDVPTTQEVIQHCQAKKIPITFCGSQTSMTGSSVADSGLTLSLAKQNKILDIAHDKKTSSPFVITEPGVILGDLKREVQKYGYHYTPDPTSYEEVQVGATIATNATGEDTFRYGPTRWYVDELEVITVDGKIKTIKRFQPAPKLPVKNLAGYSLGGEEIDAFIGSEGTLGVITKAKLKLVTLEKPNPFILILPFSTFSLSLQAVLKIATSHHNVRALELIGPGASDYFKRCPACPKELMHENCFLYLKGEYLDDTDLQAALESWFEFLKNLYTELHDKNCLERIFVARTSKQILSIRECRHFIPLTVNEEYSPGKEDGTCKISTDWWVPLPSLHDVMMQTYEESLKIKIPFLAFGHIGNGHPHWDFLCHNEKEKFVAKEFVQRQCKRAVQEKGGVAGEHGIGKIRRDLLRIQHPESTIRKMSTLKEKWDPDWLLGRGNILSFKSDTAP